MTNDPAPSESSADEKEILALIKRWSKAVRDQDREAISAHHDAGILMFDVPPPFSSRGLEACMATWETFFAYAEKPVAFNFTDVEITAGADVAFATAVGHCVNIDPKHGREPLDFRLTVGFRKINREWRVMHEHHSLPAT